MNVLLSLVKWFTFRGGHLFLLFCPSKNFYSFLKIRLFTRVKLTTITVLFSFLLTYNSFQITTYINPWHYTLRSTFQPSSADKVPHLPLIIEPRCTFHHTFVRNSSPPLFISALRARSRYSSQLDTPLAYCIKHFYRFPDKLARRRRCSRKVVPSFFFFGSLLLRRRIVFIG